MPQKSSNTSHLTQGYLIALVSSIILSTTAIFIRYLTQTYQIPALVLAFWRDVFVAMTLIPSLGIIRSSLLKIERRHLPFLIGYGLVLAIFNSLWTLSVSLNGAAIATVLVYCSAGFTAILGWWILKEQLGWAKIVAVLLSLAGCALVSGAFDTRNWGANLVGIFTGIFAGLSYAIYTLMGRTASQRGVNPWTTLLYTFGFAAVFLLAINLIGGGRLPGTGNQPGDLLWLGNALAGWGILFLLAGGPTVAGFGLYNVSLSFLPSSVANLIVTLEPVFTTITAYVLLGERMNAIQFGGAALIMAGVMFLRIYEGRSERRTTRDSGGKLQAANALDKLSPDSIKTGKE